MMATVVLVVVQTGPLTGVMMERQSVFGFVTWHGDVALPEAYNFLYSSLRTWATAWREIKDLPHTRAEARAHSTLSSVANQRSRGGFIGVLPGLGRRSASFLATPSSVIAAAKHEQDECWQRVHQKVLPATRKTANKAACTGSSAIAYACIPGSGTDGPFYGA